MRDLLNGARVNIVDKRTWTPFHIAVYNGQLDVVRELLNHAASVHSVSKIANTPLYLAAQRNHRDVVRELLKRGASV
jgi:ankyrin repeat protein